MVKCQEAEEHSKDSQTVYTSRTSLWRRYVNSLMKKWKGCESFDLSKVAVSDLRNRMVLTQGCACTLLTFGDVV